MLAITKKVGLKKYLDLEAKAKIKHLFIDGEIVEMAGASAEHNIIAANILFYIKMLSKQADKKYYVMGSDMKIYIEAFHQVRYPDVLVVSEKLEYYQGNNNLLINPLMIVEVLSPGTKAFDSGTKFEEYKSIPSLKEYVLVSQTMPYVTSYFRQADGLWNIKTVRGLETSVELKSIQSSIPLSDFYEDIVFEQ